MENNQVFLYKVLVSVIVVVLSQSILAPMKGRVDALLAQRFNLESELAIKNTYVKSEKVAENIGFFFQVLPGQSNKEELNSLITSRARDVGVSVLNFQLFDEERNLSEESLALDEVTEGSYFASRYGVDTYQVNVGGALDQVLAYIESFENGPSFVVIDSLSYTDQPSSDGGVVGRATITLSSFYQKSKVEL
jgi:hypothetical protein